MLYRAFVHTGFPFQEYEATVFFESTSWAGTPRAGVQDQLKGLVALVWRMPTEAVEFYNLFSESELRERSAQVSERGADRDTCLLEIGWGPDGTTYADPARTHLLVSPRWHARLHAAQERALAMRCAAQVAAACKAIAQTATPAAAQVPA